MSARAPRPDQAAPTLADFRPQGVNANTHTPRGLEMLDAAMAQDGYVAPMTAAADGEIFDGSARLERAAERFAGVAPIIVRHDGTRPIIAVRTAGCGWDRSRQTKTSWEPPADWNCMRHERHGAPTHETGAGGTR